MKILSKQQIKSIREEFYQNWKTCSKEMVKREKSNTVTSTRQPVLFVLSQVIQELGLWDKIDYKPHRDVHKLVKELDLKCATCGRKLGVYSEVGKYSEDEQLWESLSIRQAAPPQLYHQEKALVSGSSRYWLEV